MMTPGIELQGVSKGKVIKPVEWGDRKKEKDRKWRENEINVGVKEESDE